MSSKTANWIIAAGVLLMFIGLCFLPAALGESADNDLLELHQEDGADRRRCDAAGAA